MKNVEVARITEYLWVNVSKEKTDTAGGMNNGRYGRT